MQRKVSYTLKTLLITLVAIALATVTTYAQPPDTLWTRTYGGVDDDAGDCVRQTLDGGYIISGRSHPNQWQVKIYLIKTDENGDEIWSNNYWPSGGSDDADAIIQTPNGEYICTGHTSLGGGLYNIHWLRVDADGVFLWMYNHGSNYPDEGHCIQTTTDGNYVIAGSNRFQNSSYNDATLIKINDNGGIIWEESYTGPDHENARWVYPTSDGGYILCANTESYGAGGTDFYLIKTDENGDSLWSRVYGGSSNEELFCIQQVSDGGYIAVGYTQSTLAGDPDVYLVRTDSNGDSMWTRTFGGTGDDRGFGLQCTQVGQDIEYIVVGSTNSEGAGGYDAYIIKVDDDGNEIWHTTIGGPDDDHARKVLQNSDGNFIICGQTASFGTGGGRDAWLICLGQPVGVIVGSVTPAYEGITIDLLDDNNVPLFSVLTSGDGSYSFPDLEPGDYIVELIEPLGFVVDQNNVPVSLSGGDTATVDFVLTPLVTSNDARSKGYWKHQVNANLTGHGNPEYTTSELEEFSQDIFDCFYSNPICSIQVEGVTFTGDPAEALDLADMGEMLSINQGGSTMYQRACQQYLALFLNVVSNKLAQYFEASEDGATVSQAIVYIDEILVTNSELAKDIAETINQAQLVEAGVIPLTTPSIIFSKGGGSPAGEVVLKPESFRFDGPFPNPFNPVTNFSFHLSEEGHVSLTIYDILGRQVATLVDGWCDEGSHQVTFNGSNLASGIYFYQFNAADYHKTQKMVLLK